LSIGLGLAVSGCSSATKLSWLDEQPLVSTAAASPSMPATTATAAATVAEAPRIQAGDQVRVTVYNEASLSGNYLIDAGGFVAIPRAGKFKAAGLTSTEMADALVKRFRSEYLKDPKVTVALVEARDMGPQQF
jgi:polysaccharide export outer membrane protein